MQIRICPYCREKIHRDASVCRYCRRDLPESEIARPSSKGWLAAVVVAAIVVSGTALLAAEFFKERRNWL